MTSKPCILTRKPEVVFFRSSNKLLSKLNESCVRLLILEAFASRALIKSSDEVF